MCLYRRNKPSSLVSSSRADTSRAFFSQTNLLGSKFWFCSFALAAIFVIATTSHSHTTCRVPIPLTCKRDPLCISSSMRRNRASSSSTSDVMEITALQHTLSTIALCSCALTHSYLLISVFTYSGFLAIDLVPSANEENAGSYAGLIASAFMIGRATTSCKLQPFRTTLLCYVACVRLISLQTRVLSCRVIARWMGQGCRYLRSNHRHKRFLGILLYLFHLIWARWELLHGSSVALHARTRQRHYGVCQDGCIRTGRLKQGRQYCKLDLLVCVCHAIM